MVSKLLAFGLLILAAALSACNLSMSAKAGELALNPTEVNAEATVDVTPTTPHPTRTPIFPLSPTITILTAASGSNALVGTLAPPPILPPPEGICSVRATGDYDVNVRQGAGTDFDVVGLLPANSYLTALKRGADGWLQVQLSAGLTGWVSPKVVTLYGPCDALPAV
ncbi:MAG: SH3 domain-containing protein [Chloroflexi bacterium]|nr:SH3 domain-containing protein [Chloroflexota bacterium]MCC6892062.1 SH3 domain-containing protein [Anaerolineae bacterium]